MNGEIRNSQPKAAKEHTCEWCNETIEVGEKHNYRCYKFEGQFLTGRMHLVCEKAMSTYPNDDLLDGFDFGMFRKGSHNTRF